MPIRHIRNRRSLRRTVFLTSSAIALSLGAGGAVGQNLVLNAPVDDVEIGVAPHDNDPYARIINKTTVGNSANDQAIWVPAGVTITNGFENTASGIVFADTIESISTAVTDTQAAADAKAEAKVTGTDLLAVGLDIESGASWTGDISNKGSIGALIEADYEAVATAKTTAGAFNAKADAKVTGKDMEAYGVRFDNNVLAGFSSGSDVSAAVIVDVEATAVAEATKEANAQAKVSGFDDIIAIGLDLDGTTLTGGFENAGEVSGLVEINVGVTATATGATKADAEARAQDIEVEAVGANVDFDTIIGGVTNLAGGSITADASVTVATIATAKSGSDKAQAQSKIDDTDAEALGLEVDLDGGTLIGGVVNHGTIAANATTLMTAAATADAGTKAIAKVEVEDGDAEAVGLLVNDFDTVVGGISNTGANSILANAHLGLETSSTATGTSEATAKTTIDNMDVDATGVDIWGSTVVDGIANSGKIGVSATLDISSATSATSTGAGGKADAVADLEYLRSEAYGIDIDVGTLVAGDADHALSSTGVLNVEAGVAIDATSEATAKGKATAGIELYETYTTTAGIYGYTSTLVGGVLVDGEIVVNSGIGINLASTATSSEDNAEANTQAEYIYSDAAGVVLEGSTLTGGFESRGTISVDSGISVVASASADADGEAKAKSKIVDIDADTYGVILDYGTSLTDGFSQSGTILVNSSITANSLATANSADDKADADSKVAEVYSFAAGVILDSPILGGDFANQAGGGIYVTNGMVLESSAIADGDSKAKAKSKVENVGIDTGGILLIGGTLAGSVGNHGVIDVSTGLEMHADATATAAGKAEADSKTRNVEHKAAGIYLDVDTLTGGLENTGDILVASTFDLTAVSSAKGGEEAEAKSQSSDLDSYSYGIYWDGGTLFAGGLLNKGGISVSTTANLLADSTAEATDTGTAEAESYSGEVYIETNGIYLDYTDVFSGGFANEGPVSSMIDLTAGAQSTATANAADSKAEATAEVEYLETEAYGIYLYAGILDSFDNSGPISAVSNVAFSTDAQASATGTNGKAKAESYVYDVDSFAQGIYLDVDGGPAVISGGVLNSGLVLAESNVTGTSTAVANGKDEAKAVSDVDDVESTTYAFDVFADVLSGGFSNEGDVVSRATVDISSTATATSSDGKADAKSVVDDVEVYTDGPYIDIGTVLDGGVFNHGTVEQTAFASVSSVAEATGATKANAKAEIDDTEVDVNGFYVDVGTVLVGVDGVAFNNIGVIDVSAVADLTATATAKGGDGAEAKANIDDTDLYAEGFHIDGDIVDGSILNDGDQLIAIRGTQTATAEATATEAGSKAKADAKSELFGSAWGVQIHVSTLNGDIGNDGVVDVSVVTSGVAHASASGVDESKAKAKAESRSEGFGYDISISSVMNGDIYNHGAVSVVVIDSAEAVAKGDDDKSEAEAKSRAEAVGYDIYGPLLAGDILNGPDGSVLVIADSSAVSDAATESKAKSRADATGYEIDVDDLAGDIVNHGYVGVGAYSTADALGDAKAEAKARAYGYDIQVESIFGDFTNTGLIEVYADAAALAETTLGVDDKAKAEARATGVRLEGDGGPQTLFGDISNTADATILAVATADAVLDPGPDAGDSDVAEGKAEAFAIRLEDGVTVTGGLYNDGNLIASAQGTTKGWAVGVLIQDSQIDGGIHNTGLIWAEAEGSDFEQADAINTVEASAAHVINLLDGNGFVPNGDLDPSINPLWKGDNPLGIIGDIRLSEDYGDTINWSGGDIHGNIFGNYTVGHDDVLNVFAGAADVFDYDGDIDGLYQINVNTLAGLGTPVELTYRGYATDTLQLNVNADGTLVMGATHLGWTRGIIEVETYNHDADGTVLFELTPDPAQVGYIQAYGPTLNIDGGVIGIRPVLTFEFPNQLNQNGVQSGLYADTQFYDVIFSDVRTGAFDDTFSPTPLLEVDVVYGNFDGGVGDPDSDVRLIVDRVAFDAVAGLTPNQRAVAGGIENVYDPVLLDGTPFGNGVGLLFLLDHDQYPAALTTLHGAEHAQMLSMGLRLADPLLLSVQSRLSAGRTLNGGAGTMSAGVPIDISGQLASLDRSVGSGATPSGLPQTAQGSGPGSPMGARGLTLWGNVSGSWADGDGDASLDVVGFDRTSVAGVIGLDYQLTPEILLGVVGMYQSTDIDFEDGDRGDADGFQLGAYGSYDSGTWYVDGVISYGWYDFETARRVALGPFEIGTARGDYSARLFTAGGEVGYVFRQDMWSITPSASLAYSRLSTSGFTETGAAPFNLRVDSGSADSLASTLAVRAAATFSEGNMIFVPEARLGWRHEFMDGQQSIRAAFAGVPGSSFSSVGTDFGRDSLVAGAGITARVATNLDVFVQYDGEFSSDYDQHTVIGGLRFTWGGY